jgi:hypothetical protein
MNKLQFRQGDVMLEKISALPAKVKRVPAEGGRLIVARGEVTGHAHAVAEEMGEMYVDESGRIYLQIETETEIVHEEHGAIPLPVGVYVYTPQREYHPEAIRNVLD